MHINSFLCFIAQTTQHWLLLDDGDATASVELAPPCVRDGREEGGETLGAFSRP